MKNIFNYADGKFNLNDKGSFKRYFVALFFFALLIFTLGLGEKDLTGSDEPRVAGIGAEMAFSGNYVVPELNNRAFLEKPPLFFWGEALSFKTFGYNNFAARFPSAAAAIAGVLIIYLLAAALGFSPFVGFTSGAVLCLAAQYWATGRTCLIDMMLAAFTTATVYTFYKLCKAEKIKFKLIWLLGFALATGGAIFSKGLVGLAIPGVAVGSWLFFSNILNKKITWLNWILLAAGSVLAFVPVAIWLYFLCGELGWEEGGYVVVWTNNFGRFTGGHKEHVEPFYYYLSKLPEFFQPWTVFIPFALYYHFMELKKHKSDRSLMLLCWFLLPYTLLTVSAAKRRVYLLPLNPALAILIGTWVGGILSKQITLPQWFKLDRVCYWIGFALAPVAGIIGIVSLVLGICFKLPVTTLLAISLPGLIVSVFMILTYKRKRYGIFCGWMLIMLLTGFYSISTVVADIQNAKHSSRPIFVEAKKVLDSGRPLLFYRPWDRITGASLFYLQKNIPYKRKMPEFQKLLADNPQAVILVSDEDKQPAWKELTRFKFKKHYFVFVVPEKEGK